MLNYFDIFPKFKDRSIRVKTFYGGIITMFTLIWISVVITLNLIDFFKTSEKENIIIDDDYTIDKKKIYINFDVIIHSPCSKIHIDLIRRDGKEKKDIIENITQISLTSNNTPVEEDIMNMLRVHQLEKDHLSVQNKCMSCHGAKSSECCNTCMELLQTFKKEGLSFAGFDRFEQCEGLYDFSKTHCNLVGSIPIKRQKSEIHFGLGRNIYGNGKYHEHDTSSVKSYQSVNHTINYVSFGDHIAGYNSLDGVNGFNERDDNNWAGVYFFKVVPLHYNKNNIHTDNYKYSVTYTQRDIPTKNKRVSKAIYFFVEFLQVKFYIETQRERLISLLTKIASTIGGTFSVASVLDALIHSASRRRRLGVEYQRLKNEFYVHS